MPPPKPKDSNNANSLDAEIRSNVLKVAQIERKHRAERTFAERLSELIARFCGTMTFVWIHVGWFAGWVLVNTLTGFRFDPFPFTFLTLVVSLEAIFLSTFILITQNQETRMTDRRNQLDLQINMLAEQENTKMLEVLAAIAEKVGVSYDNAAMKALKKPTDPKKLVEEIMSTIEGKNDSP
jgi:uncharacterized membrane protein